MHLSPRNTTTRKHTSKRNTLSEDEERLQKVSRFEQNRASRIITSKLRENPKSILTFKCKGSGYKTIIRSLGRWTKNVFNRPIITMHGDEFLANLVGWTKNV